MDGTTNGMDVGHIGGRTARLADAWLYGWLDIDLCTHAWICKVVAWMNQRYIRF